MRAPKRDAAATPKSARQATESPKKKKKKAAARAPALSETKRETKRGAKRAAKPAGVKRPIQRLTFNEITERAVQQALQQPRDLDMNLVNAQQARRVLDRLVGYKVSPFVWRTVRYGLSAGRVQSVALRLICEREEAIRAFVPEEYWTLEVDYETRAGARFTARLVRVGEQELEQGHIKGAGTGADAPAARATALAEEARGAAARVTEVETAPKQVHPKPPFITSTLQQTAYNR